MSTSARDMELLLESLHGITDVSVSFGGSASICNATGGIGIISFAMVEPHNGDVTCTRTDLRLKNCGTTSFGTVVHYCHIHLCATLKLLNICCMKNEYTV